MVRFRQCVLAEITPQSGESPAKRSGVKGAIDALGRVVITHGHDGDVLCDDTWAYDPATSAWTDISPTPELRPMARYDHDLLALPAWGVILLSGGCSDGVGPCPQPDLWMLDQYGGWSDITPYTGPTPRTSSAIAQLDGTILQVGGMTDLGPESDVWRGSFDGGTIEWQELTLVNHGPMGIDRRSGHDMTAAGSEFYVFGGDGVEGAISDLWQFSLDRFSESEHTLDPNSDFDDSGVIEDRVTTTDRTTYPNRYPETTGQRRLPLRPPMGSAGIGAGARFSANEVISIRPVRSALVADGLGRRY